MKLTKGVISRDEAFKLVPEYVNFIESTDYEPFDIMVSKFQTLKRGHAAIAYFDGQYVKVKVSSVNHKDYRAVDGPIVRVSNGEGSWRVDGNEYAAPYK